MSAVHHPYLLVIGVILLAAGTWLWRYSNRHGIDIKGAAISSGATAAWRREMPQVPGDIQDKYNRIAAEKSHLGKAKAASGTVIRAGLAKVAFLVSLVVLAGGLGAIVAALLWK